MYWPIITHACGSRCVGNNYRQIHYDCVNIWYKFGRYNSPVTSELTRVSCVQQASISTRASSTTLAKERQSVIEFVSLLFVERRHYYAVLATRYALPHVSSLRHSVERNVNSVDVPSYTVDGCIYFLTVKQWSVKTSLAHLAKLLIGLYVLVTLFFFIFNDRSETNYFRIHWIDFRDIFTKW